MSRVLLIGGHGKIALLLEPLLVDRGDTVTAVIRNPDHDAEVGATGAAPLVADVQSFDVDQLTNLVSGNDAVVWAAGGTVAGVPARLVNCPTGAEPARTMDHTLADVVYDFVI